MKIDLVCSYIQHFVHVCKSLVQYLPFNKEARLCLSSKFLFAELINIKEGGENEERHRDYS